MVIDANTGAVLVDRDGDAPRHPASLTKMMTLYLTFEQIEAGKLSYGSTLTVSGRAADADPSKLGLDAGDKIRLIDAIKAVIVKSANDAAVVLAERIAGSEQEFAALMTRRARQIGMKSTVFRNASGLPNDEQVTTARDMLTLAMRLQDDFPRHYGLFSLQSFSYGGKTHRTHNTLMGRFPGMDGIKTGYTRSSGFNLVSSVKTGGKHVVGAVFGGASAAVRNAYMRSIMFSALDDASAKRTRWRDPQLVAEARPAKRPANKNIAALAPPAPRPAVRAEQDAHRAATGPDWQDRAALSALAAEEPFAGEPASEDQPSIARAAANEPILDFAALRATLRNAREEANAASSEKSGDGRASQIAELAPHPDAPASDTETVVVKSNRATGTSLVLGRAPGTLAAQAERLSVASIVPASAEVEQPTAMPAFEQPQHLGGPSATGPTAYDIQIGAFASATDAEDMMARAQSAAGAALDGHAAMALPLEIEGRQIYRARFAGFDAAKAERACQDLKRSAFECRVVAAQ